MKTLKQVHAIINTKTVAVTGLAVASTYLCRRYGFVTVLPVLYGSYFAAISQDYSIGLAYVMPVLFYPVLVSLDNIQEYLENPFDQIVTDDIAINAEKFVERLKLS